MVLTVMSWIKMQKTFSKFSVKFVNFNTESASFEAFCLQNTGVEQQRHHAVEVAVYGLLSELSEIETGQVYKMTKPHDIYSGLGADDRRSGDESDVASTAAVADEEAELAKSIKRAECIVESYSNVKARFQ